MADATLKICWQCEEDIVGEAHPRFDPDDPWQGPLTEDDYLCTPCMEGKQDAYLEFYSAY